MMNARGRTTNQPKAAPESVTRALRKPGRSLEPRSRAVFEHRYRAPLHHVRVREDAASTRELRATAYTVGPDVVFAPGRYTPGTRSGDALLGHELAHVIQQREARVEGAPPAVLSIDHPAEREAERGTPHTRLPLVAVQRTPADASTGAATPGRKEETQPRVPGAFAAGVLQSPIALRDLLADRFSAGFVLGLASREASGQRLSKVVTKWQNWGVLDRVEYAAGLLLGFLRGLVSPVVDLALMVVSIVQFAIKANIWVLEKALKLITGSTAAKQRDAAVALAIRLAQLDLKIREVLTELRKDPRSAFWMLGQLADMALEGMLTKTQELGSAVADKVLEFYEQSFFTVGYEVGYVIGFMTITIALLFFTEGVGNAIQWIAKALEGLGAVGAAIVRVARLIIAAIGTIVGAIKRMIAWFVGKLGTLVRELGVAFEDLGKLVQEMLPGLEAAELEGAEGAAGGRVFMSTAGKETGPIVPRDPELLKALKGGTEPPPPAKGATGLAPEKPVSPPAGKSARPSVSRAPAPTRTEERGRAILEEFRSRSATAEAATAEEAEADLLEALEVEPQRRYPGRRPVPESFDVGNFSHDFAEELIPESRLPRGLDPEVTIDLPGQGSVRLDRVDWDNGFVYEIKPNSISQMRKGEDQIVKYVEYLNREYPRPPGKSWSGRVVTYDRVAVRAFLRRIGWLAPREP